MQQTEIAIKIHTFATANGGRSDGKEQGKVQADTQACFEASGP
jgi:hypothetical protein